MQSKDNFILNDTCPENFHDAIIAAGGYCTFEGKLLLLKRHPKKLFGNMWGVPGGKLEEGETPEDGLVREIYEEIGVVVDKTLVEPIHTFYIQSASSISHTVIYHMFYCPMSEMPQLVLHLEEHLEALWVTPDEGLKLPLVSAGGIEAIQIYQKFLHHRKIF